MKILRRTLLSTGTAAILIYASDPAEAILFSGAQISAGGSTLIQTMTVQNTSGSTTPINSHLPMFTILAKKGDFPTGTYPILKTSGGTICQYSYSAKTTWSDGSLMILPILPIFPDAVAGSGTASLKIYNGGTAPAASSRTLTEVSNAAIQVIGVGWDSTLSGTWTMDLATAITDNIQIVVEYDGTAGKCWRIHGNFKQSGSPHGQLICHTYVWARSTSAGALADFLVLPRVTQPFFDLSSPTPNRRNFSSLVLNYGAGPTTYNPVTTCYTPTTFTWDSVGVDGSGNHTLFDYVGSPGMIEGTPIQLTNAGGSLPGGVSAGVTYFFRPYSPGKMQICSTPPQGVFNGEIGTSSGSGVNTVTPGNMVAQYGSQFMPTTQGRYVWFQGAGSNTAEATLRIKKDVVYELSSGIYPPYAQNLIGSVVNNASYPWSPQSVGPINPAFGETGESQNLGILPTYAVRQIYTQAAIDELAVRTIGYSTAQVSTHFRSVTGNKLINLGGPTPTYTGMNTATSSALFRPSSGAAGGGINAPLAPMWNQVYQSNTCDHCPNLPMAAWLFTGEPQFRDLVFEFANMAIMSTPLRNVTQGATNYYAQAFYDKDNGLREDAWFFRNLIQAWILPDTPTDGSQSTQYIRDLVTSNGAFITAWIAASPSYWTTTGFFTAKGSPNPPLSRGAWNVGYAGHAACWAAKLTEDANIRAFVTHLTKWPKHIYDTYGNTFMLVTFVESGQNNSTTYLSDDAHWGAIAGLSLNWDSGTNLFTTGTTTWTIADGDKYFFWRTATGSPPTNFSLTTPYYAVNTNVGARTFQLSSTLGGSPITIGSTGGVGGSEYFLAPVNTPSTKFVEQGGNAPSSYQANIQGYINWAIADGLAVAGSSTVWSDIESRINAWSVPDWADDPKWRMQASF